MSGLPAMTETPTTLVEELEQAAEDLHDSGLQCHADTAARLRARAEHVRKFMAVRALLSDDGRDFAERVAGPLPGRGATPGEPK